MFCSQLDWAFAGTKLSGQLQVRCLIYQLPSPGHDAHDAFSQIVSEGKLLALKFEILEDFQKVAYFVCPGEDANQNF